MIKGKKVVVVMPAYNAQETLEKTVREVDPAIVDEIVLIDDASGDRTVAVAAQLGLSVHQHEKNLGYGANQKSCYRMALKKKADIVIMVHPDYQYDPRLIPSMAYMLANNTYDAVLGSRILGNKVASSGMPLWRWIANRFLTFFQNIALREKLSEYHTGYRAFTREVLLTLPLEENSDDFIFDNEMICQMISFNFRIGEISCPTRYLSTSSSISFPRAVKYGCGVIRVTLQCVLHKMRIVKCFLFSREGRRLTV